MRTSIKLLGLTLALGSATVIAADHSSHSTSSAMKSAVIKDADNSDINSRDKNGETLTAQKQSNSESDIKVLAAARSSVVDDDTLSTAAHNVKILVVNGTVTLRGPVKNASEKARVEELVRKVPGVVSINNRLEIDAK